MEKIVVIGGAGYLGSKLVPALLNSGYAVHVIDPLWFGNYLPIHDNLIISPSGVQEVSPIEFQGASAVIFLGGISNDPMVGLAPGKSFEYNVAHPLYAAHVAKQAGVPLFIFASSCSVYGNLNGATGTVDTPIKVNYPYGVAKYSAEQGLMAMMSDPFKVIIFRMGTLSGYSPRMRFDLLLNTFYKNAILDRTIKITSAEINRPILDINDAVVHYCNAVIYPDTYKSVENIYSANGNLLEFARYVRSWFAEKLNVTISIENKMEADMRNYRAGNMDAREKSLKTCVYDILDELYDKTPPGSINFHDAKHYNVEVFKALLKEERL